MTAEQTRLHTVDASTNGHVDGFYRHTDIGNAERFAAQHGRVVRFVPEWRAWLVWDGRCWVSNTEGVQVLTLAKATAVSIYDDLDQARISFKQAEQSGDDARRDTVGEFVKSLIKHAPRSSTEPRIRAMLTLAQSEPGIAVSASLLDQDTHVLNTQNGVVNLETGELRAHDTAALCTHITAAGYDPKAPTTVWSKFLGTIFEHNEQLIRYVQRLIGLALTGNPGERLLPIGEGPGGNGKTAFFNAVQRQLGEYATSGDAGGLLLGKDDGRPNEHVASLAGRRLVILAELPKGRLNTSMVKRLTGGDRISAHRKFEHVFEFTPTHTFFVYTNDRPEVQETGRAVWDRIRLIPFNHTFTAEERLPSDAVKRALDAEADGILTWCVQGAVDYLRDGLGDEPECVRLSTSQYEEEEDVIGRFLDERTVRDPEAWTRTAELYKAYRDWCIDQGMPAMSQVAVGRDLSKHGLESRKGTGGVRGFAGVRLEGTLS